MPIYAHRRTIQVHLQSSKAEPLACWQTFQISSNLQCFSLLPGVLLPLSACLTFTDLVTFSRGFFQTI